MNARRLVLWIVVVAVSAIVIVRWQRVEAWAPQGIVESTAGITAETVLGETRYHVMAYEAKLHGWRPMGDDAQTKENHTPQTPEPIVSTSDRLRDESLGEAPPAEEERPPLSTPSQTRAAGPARGGAVGNDGRGRQEPTEW